LKNADAFAQEEAKKAAAAANAVRVYSDDPEIRAIEEAIDARAAAKKAKNYAEADRIRAELLEKGIVLTDTPNGTTFERKA
jgi:cysteinyl-tRNA synthetase